MDGIMKERDVYFKNELRAAGLFEKLASFMSEEEVLNFCRVGRLCIHKDGHEPYTYQFNNPNLIGLDMFYRICNYSKMQPKQLSMQINLQKNMGSQKIHQ